MAMVCPRCATAVPIEALYCPYCSLPKPKAGFATDSVNPGASNTSPGSKKSAPAVSRNSPGPVNRPIAFRARARRRIRPGVLSVAALVALFTAGIYIFVVPLVRSEVDPRAALSALDKLQRTQSNQPELTIDARMSRELEASRRVGNLVSYQGWSVHPVKGTKTKALLVFSYREVGNVEQRAEWVADLTNNTFAPRTALAVSVSR